MSSPIIGGGAPLLGSEALSPSVSVGVSKIGLVPITCQRRRPCSLHSILYYIIPYRTRPSWSAGGGMTWVWERGSRRRLGSNRGGVASALLRSNRPVGPRYLVDLWTLVLDVR
jgi:hypothetical protein